VNILNDNPVCFQAGFCALTGHVIDAVYLTHVIRLTKRVQGAFLLDHEAIKTEIGMGNSEQNTALRRLQSKGVIEPCGDMNERFRVDFEKLEKLMSAKPDFIDKEQTDGHHKLFIMLWKKEFLREFGEGYVMRAKQDNAAISKLIRLGEPAFLIAKVKKAWTARGEGDNFHCKRATTIAGFFSAYNEITAELPKANATGVSEQQGGFSGFGQ
jgi:hypothetical protein